MPNENSRRSSQRLALQRLRYPTLAHQPCCLLLRVAIAEPRPRRAGRRVLPSSELAEKLPEVEAAPDQAVLVVFDREPGGIECLPVLVVGEEGSLVMLREMLGARGCRDEVGEVHDRKDS